MSLPRYVVNIEEFANLIDDVFEELKHGENNPVATGVQKSKGFRLLTSKKSKTISKVWEPEEDIWVTGVKLGISNKQSWKGNKISLLLNDEFLFQDVFMKKEADYKTFRVAQKVAAGSRVEIIFESLQTEIEAWLDFDFTDNSSGELIISPKDNLNIE